MQAFALPTDLRRVRGYPTRLALSLNEAAIGDARARMWRWDAVSIATDDGISVIKSEFADVGRWVPLALQTDGVSTLASCTSLEQVNALYQGLAGRPDLDFTPEDLGTPDVENQRISFVSGNHWTLSGSGTKSRVVDGPLGPVAMQFEGDRVFQIMDADVFDITTEAMASHHIAAYTANGSNGADVGGHVIGKFSYPPGSGLGWGMTSNGGVPGVGGGSIGMTGFNGDLGNLNDDIPPGPLSTFDDGFFRLFQVELSRLDGGLGIVRADGQEISVAGNPGNIHCDDGFLGLAQMDGAVSSARGDQHVLKVALWRGTPAENVIAYRAEIEAVLQAQLEFARAHGPVTAGEGYLIPTSITIQAGSHGTGRGVSREGHVHEAIRANANAAGLIGPIVFGNPARVLDASFQPDPNKNTRGQVCVRITNGSGDVGRIQVLIGDNDPPAQIIDECRAETAGLHDFTLHYEVTPGQWVKFLTIGDTGNPAFSLKFNPFERTF